MVTTLSALFDDLNEDATAWATDITGYVPGWLLTSEPARQSAVEAS
jgi:hypothetical protein